MANSPLMSFFYHYPAPEYRAYMNKEGKLNKRAYIIADNRLALSARLGRGAERVPALVEG